MHLTRIFEYIKSDLYRYTGHLSADSFFKAYVTSRGFRYSFWLRLCSSENYIVRIIARYKHRKYGWKFGIDIPHTTKIGKGLYLGHGIGVVINHTTTIGPNCNISHFVSIGSTRNRAARIGSNVYIGPNVSIIEDVQIEDNVTIGAGSVVLHNASANVTIAGIPANKISQGKNFIQNPWPPDRFQ